MCARRVKRWRMARCCCADSRGRIESELIAGLREIVAQAPFRHMVTPGGHQMSVAMTNCGNAGWVTDRRPAIATTAIDPESGQPWPAMPPVVSRSGRAGGGRRRLRRLFARCLPDQPLRAGRADVAASGQERTDFAAPIVSVSLGLPATFLFGGPKRSDKPQRYRLEHGDVVVWGGPSRLSFHGVAPLADGEHACWAASASI